MEIAKTTTVAAKGQTNGEGDSTAQTATIIARASNKRTRSVTDDQMERATVNPKARNHNRPLVNGAGTATPAINILTANNAPTMRTG